MAQRRFEGLAQRDDFLMQGAAAGGLPRFVIASWCL